MFIDAHEPREIKWFGQVHSESGKAVWCKARLLPLGRSFFPSFPIHTKFFSSAMTYNRGWSNEIKMHMWNYYVCDAVWQTRRQAFWAGIQTRRKAERSSRLQEEKELGPWHQRGLETSKNIDPDKASFQKLCLCELESVDSKRILWAFAPFLQSSEEHRSGFHQYLDIPPISVFNRYWLTSFHRPDPGFQQRVRHSWFLPYANYVLETDSRHISND